MNRREVEKEIESLDVESRRVAELLGGLKRVEAPSNFEFGVRARIANGAPVHTSTWLPVLKLAAPLALILVVAVMVVFYQTTPKLDTAKFDDAAASPASSEGLSTLDRNDMSNNSEQVSGPRSADGPQELVLSPPVPRRITPNASRRPDRSSRPAPSTGGSSRVDALRPANTIDPPGIRSLNQGNTNLNSISGNQADVPVREVLEILGVSADPSDDGWKVKSTVDGSIARKSGIQSGDVIEAIDGRAITNSTSFKGASGGKTIRVRRDGKSVDLKLTN